MLNFALLIRQGFRASLPVTLACSFAVVPFNSARSQNLKDASGFQKSEIAGKSVNEKSAVVDSSSSSSSGNVLPGTILFTQFSVLELVSTLKL
jgi:hypothetical protein